MNRQAAGVLPAIKTLLSLSMFVLFASSCGGGGGGGDGEGRTTETAVRIIHASLDTMPLTVASGPLLLQKARYLDITGYVPVPDGPTILTVERANLPGSVLANLNLQLEPETEYTVFVTSRPGSGDEQAVALADPVARPEEGFGRIQLLNAVEASGRIALKGANFDSGPALEGASSGFRDVPFGPISLSLIDRNGREMLPLALDVPDRGELTVVGAGSGPLGVAFARVYPDLD